jgi:hypothetical protein
MMRPSDHQMTKILSDAHVELLRGRRKRAPRPTPRAN